MNNPVVIFVSMAIFFENRPDGAEKVNVEMFFRLKRLFGALILRQTCTFRHKCAFVVQANFKARTIFRLSAFFFLQTTLNYLFPSNT